MTTANAPTGCTFVVGKVKKWNSVQKEYAQTAVFCHKVTANDSAYCPRHKLIAAELSQQRQSEERSYHGGS